MPSPQTLKLSWTVVRVNEALPTVVLTMHIKQLLRHGLMPGVLLFTSCARAPSFNIVGSFFPAWLVCLMLGILAAAISHMLLLRVKVALAFTILVYPSLAALLTFLLWLVFFS